MSRKRLLILILVLFISPASFSQNNITGIWEGKFFTADTDLGQPKLVVEIYDFKDSLFSGVTHLYYKERKYEHYKMIGWYDKKDSLLVFMEASTIAVDLGRYANCLGTYKMSLSKQGSYLVQNGYCAPNIRGCSFTSQIWLQKKIDEIKEEPAPAKKTGAIKKPAAINKPAPTVNTLKGKITTPVIAATPPVTVAKNTPEIKAAP